MSNAAVRAIDCCTALPSSFHASLHSCLSFDTQSSYFQDCKRAAGYDTEFRSFGTTPNHEDQYNQPQWSLSQVLRRGMCGFRYVLTAQQYITYKNLRATTDVPRQDRLGCYECCGRLLLGVLHFEHGFGVLRAWYGELRLICFLRILDPRILGSPIDWKEGTMLVHSCHAWAQLRCSSGKCSASHR